MDIPSAVVQRGEINNQVHAVEAQLAPDVVKIGYDIAEDWSGRWAIFFKVVLSDDASRRERLGEVVAKVVWSLAGKLDFNALGVFPYHNFRSVSEQRSLREEAWA
jgi:hypothetical protein